jgi:DNA-binding NarL/FixJ family response regulator
MYRVLLVDDHAVVRKGVKAILEDELPGVTVSEASSGAEALAAIGAPLDVVVLDLSMPGRSGIDLLVEMKHRQPKLPILIMSLFGEEQFAARALKAGASGYLTKSAAPAELVGAITKVARGGRYVSAAFAERLAAAVAEPSDRPLHEQLSDREFEVLRRIASGKSVGDIAVEMHLSVNTISTYRTRLLQKMKMSSNAELVRYAIDHQLV